MPKKISAFIIVAAVALCLAPNAFAASAPRVQRDLEMQTEGHKPPFSSVMLSFVTTRKAAKVQVSIDGRPSDVVSPWTRHVLVFSGKFPGGKKLGHFRTGRKYPVRIRLCSASGKCSTMNRKLKLHRTWPTVEGP